MSYSQCKNIRFIINVCCYWTPDSSRERSSYLSGSSGFIIHVNRVLRHVQWNVLRDHCHERSPVSWRTTVYWQKVDTFEPQCHQNHLSWEHILRSNCHDGFYCVGGLFYVANTMTVMTERLHNISNTWATWVNLLNNYTVSDSAPDRENGEGQGTAYIANSDLYIMKIIKTIVLQI